MNALVIILNIVLILISIVLIAIVLMQQGQRQGLGAIAGGAETFLGKNAAKGLDGKLAKLTKIAAVVFIILAIVTTIIVSHNNGYEAPSGAYLDGDHIHLEDGTTVDLAAATEEQLAQIGLDAESAASLAAALEAESDHIHNEDGTITDLEGNVITEEEAHGTAVVEDHGDHVHNEDGTITDAEGNVITEEEAHG